MKNTSLAILAACGLIASTGCNKDKETGGTSAPPAETLSPEPDGAPDDLPNGRMTCVGDNEPEAPAGSVLELPGYVRTYADPGATEPPPDALVEAFDESGASIGSAFADGSKDGRVAVSVPVTQAGFLGHVMITHEDYLDWRFKASNAVTTTDFNGWTWLLTADELTTETEAAGITQSGSDGLLVGAVHDCDAFGIDNVVIQVDGSTDGVHYIDGWGPDDGATYSTPTGRFVVPNVSPGTVEVKAFARLESGGPLTLISSVQTEVMASSEGVSAVALEPRPE